MCSLCRDLCGSESSEQGHTALDRCGVEDQGLWFGGSQSSRRIYCLCKTQSCDLTFAVETRRKEKADLEASLVQLGAPSGSLQTKISDLAGSTATTEADLKAATAIWRRNR